MARIFPRTPMTTFVIRAMTSAACSSRRPISMLVLSMLLSLLIGCSEAPDEATAPTEATAAAATSSAPPTQDQETSAATAPAKQAVTLNILDISEREHNGRNALAVTLSTPLDPAADFQGYFSVVRTTSKHQSSTPQKTNGYAPTPVDGAWILSDSGKVAWFDHLEPETGYDITIYQGLTAANGLVLANNYQQELTTRPLKASATFATQGHFLIDGIGQGLPISAVNIDAVNIDFFPHQRRQYWPISQSHKPPLPAILECDIDDQPGTTGL